MILPRTLEPTPAQAASPRLGTNASGLVITASSCFPRHASIIPHYATWFKRKSLSRPTQTSFIKYKEIQPPFTGETLRRSRNAGLEEKKLPGLTVHGFERVIKVMH